MNFGDRVELQVVVQNQTDKDMAVDVAIRDTNAVLGVSPDSVSSPDDLLSPGTTKPETPDDAQDDSKKSKDQEDDAQ
jgi:hypothetical protein